MKSIDENKFFIIEQRTYSYPKEHFKYSIMKEVSYDLTMATRMLLAYEQLNDSDTTKYHLQKVDLSFEDPILLTEEVA
tara:strand:- start:374 stop:607 length:234 start_codon:yes stop_codon:yes gene_type:complete